MNSRRSLIAYPAAAQLKSHAGSTIFLKSIFINLNPKREATKKSKEVNETSTTTISIHIKLESSTLDLWNCCDNKTGVAAKRSQLQGMQMCINVVWNRNTVRTNSKKR